MFRKIKKWFNLLGPGLITGAADDDPSGIATYSQTGSQFGYGQLWTALFMLPFQIGVQEACGRIGAVKRKGLMAVIRENYSRKTVFSVALLVLVANTINIGADIGAMAAAAQLLVPMSFGVLAIDFTLIILMLEIFTSYKTYSRILKWLALTLIAYPITVFIVDQPWGQIWRSSLIPHFEFSFQFLFVITGVFGTTISPYMFFWQASEEVEEIKEKHLARAGKGFLKNLIIDTRWGMFFSELATWSIIVVSATVLNGNGITTINTSADAAKALEPLVQSFPQAGLLAKIIFATGIIGLGLLSIPVLSGSASYAVAEVFGWKEGLNYKFGRAKGFYGVIIASTLVGLLMNFFGIDPVKALIYTAVINGLVAIPLIFLIASIAQSKKIMGNYQSNMLSRVLVWLTFGVMTVAGVTMLFTFFYG